MSLRPELVAGFSVALLGLTMPLSLAGGQRAVLSTKHRAVDSSLVLGRRSQLHSDALGQEMTIDVHLPTEYAEQPRARFPVLYVLDGSEYFLPVVSAEEFLADRTEMPRMIVVGVQSHSRSRDFTPPLTLGRTAPAGLGPVGGAEQFERYLASELIPYVERRYRTQPFRVLAGHSLGGLLATDVMLHRPDLFHGFVVLDPSVWWDGRSTVDSALAFFRRRPRYVGRLAIVEGAASVEGWRPSWDQVSPLIPPTLKVSRIDLVGESHESMGYRGFYEGLRALFADFAPVFRLNAAELTRFALDSQYAALSAELGYHVDVPTAVLSELADRRATAPAPSVPSVRPSAGSPFVGTWSGVQASTPLDSTQLVVRIHQEGDSLVWSSTLTGVRDPSMHFTPQPLYLEVIGRDTIRALRIDQAKNRYIQTLVLNGTALSGDIILEPHEPPPPGISLRTIVRLTRDR